MRWIFGTLLLATCGQTLSAEAQNIRYTPQNTARREIMNEDDYQRATAPYALGVEERTTNRLRDAYGDPGIFARPRAGKIMDRVTIIVDDAVTVRNRQQTDMTRDSSSEWALNDFFTIRRGNDGWEATPRGDTAATAAGLAIAKTPRFRSGSIADHAAEATNNVSTAMATELSGTVISVLPNGHLVIEARKTQEVNGETMTVILTGIVDPRDMDANNRVEDRFLMERKVRITGKGVFNNFNKRGLIPRLFDNFPLF